MVPSNDCLLIKPPTSAQACEPFSVCLLGLDFSLDPTSRGSRDAPQLGRARLQGWDWVAAARSSQALKWPRTDPVASHLLSAEPKFVCQTPAIADIVILVDGSWSIGRFNFRLVRLFLENLVTAFNVGSGETRVGGCPCLHPDLTVGHQGLLDLQ